MVRVGDIEDQNLLEDGKYTFKIKKTEVKKGPKANYINLEMTVVSGVGAGRSFFDRLMLGPKSLFRIKAFLIAFGQEDADLVSVSRDPVTKVTVVDENSLAQEIISLVRGGTAVADIGSEGETQNKETGEKYPPRNKVRAYLPITEATGEAVAWPE